MRNDDTQNLVKYWISSLKYDMDRLRAMKDLGSSQSILDTMGFTIGQLERELVEDPMQQEELKTLTMDQVARFNGSFGVPSYVVANGMVYDVSHIPSWTAGRHFGQIAGTDVTAALDCHNGQTVLNRARLVGVLVE